MKYRMREYIIKVKLGPDSEVQQELRGWVIGLCCKQLG